MKQPPRPIEATDRLDVEMMGLCLELAREAERQGEVPVGSVVVRDGSVLARCFNRTIQDRDPTAHAERLALAAAGLTTGDWRLNGCVLYVTLEPCIMCAGALVLSRVDRLVYGASDPKAGACQSLYRVLGDPRLNHQVRVTQGVLQEACSNLLTSFFRQSRSI